MASGSGMMPAKQPNQPDFVFKFFQMLQGNENLITYCEGRVQIKNPSLLANEVNVGGVPDGVAMRRGAVRWCQRRGDARCDEVSLRRSPGSAAPTETKMTPVPLALALQVLPRYFRTSRFSSFQRQLNK